MAMTYQQMMANLAKGDSAANTASTAASAGANWAGIGGLAGGIASGISSLANLGLGIYNTSQENKRRAQAQQAINNWQSEATSLLNNAEANQVNLSGANDLATYNKLKSSYNPEDYIYDFDEFDTSKYNVEDYLNSNRSKILNDVADTAQHTAAGSALGHSSGAATAIASAVADKDEDLYNTAYQQMQSDKTFDYNAYSNYIAQKQNQLSSLQQGVLNQMNNLRSDITFDQEQSNNNLNNRLSLGNSVMQAKASLV